MKPTGLAIQERSHGSDPEDIDISEKGRSASGEEISSDRRLFMQFMAFGGVEDTQALIERVDRTAASPACSMPISTTPRRRPGAL